VLLLLLLLLLLTGLTDGGQHADNGAHKDALKDAVEQVNRRSFHCRIMRILQGPSPAKKKTTRADKKKQKRKDHEQDVAGVVPVGAW
jgi:cytosine/adenosine deaminase-related metal-dependent hydrolase